MTELYLEMRLLQRDGAYLIWAVLDRISGGQSSETLVFRGFRPGYVPYPPPPGKMLKKQKEPEQSTSVDILFPQVSAGSI